MLQPLSHDSSTNTTPAREPSSVYRLVRSGGPVPEARGGQRGQQHDISLFSRAQSGTIVDFCTYRPLGSSYLPQDDRAFSLWSLLHKELHGLIGPLPRNRSVRNMGAFRAHTTPPTYANHDTEDPPKRQPFAGSLNAHQDAAFLSLDVVSISSISSPRKHVTNPLPTLYQ